jgi:hypothetical protein
VCRINSHMYRCSIVNCLDIKNSSRSRPRALLALQMAFSLSDLTLLWGGVLDDATRLDDGCSGMRSDSTGWVFDGRGNEEGEDREEGSVGVASTSGAAVGGIIAGSAALALVIGIVSWARETESKSSINCNKLPIYSMSRKTCQEGSGDE